MNKTHGLNSLKARITKRNPGKIKLQIERKLDLRAPIARLLMAEKDGWIADMGGPENISAKQQTIIEAATKTLLFIWHIDSWLMQQPRLVNRRGRDVIPALKSRGQMVNSLASLLGMLGLERKAKPVQSLNEYIKSTTDNGHSDSDK